MPDKSLPQHGAMIGPRPPLAAYREDLARHGGDAFGSSDATWLSVSTIVSHALAVPADSRPPLAESLRSIVQSDPEMAELAGLLEPTATETSELDGISRLLRALVNRMEDAGALQLGYTTLFALSNEGVGLSVLEQGRVFAQLGRIAWKAGALDTSRGQYRRAEVLGRRAKIPELRVRAWVGYSIIARLHGNYPEVREWGAKAALEAERHGLPELGALAYQGLMRAAAIAGDYSGALVYGWRAFQGALGNPDREASALLNLSQYLLECGQPEAALRGFAVTLDRRPAPRVAFPALGGLSVAAAMLGDRAIVRETQARIDQLIASTPIPYEAAATLLELSQALARIGIQREAADARRRALEIAQRHAYHELVHRVEQAEREAPPRAPVARDLDPEGTEVVRAVASLQLAGAGGDDAR